eukprot:TRINITY_DN55480_c1_g1_i1.p1 TRINITY_DN55480_c1_g1~~TRINITY_DN55480_c1_g1_i1.p1  ORF type:complete len:420 (+),score=89.82 TRINITY_DN55480_c1_g1_i1:75-1334(+)
MSMRCLSVLAAVAQPAFAIQSQIFSGEEGEIGLALSVQMRQYAFLGTNEELTDGLDLDVINAPKPSHLVALSSVAKRLGESASLNEAGYNAVVSLRSQDAMEAFTERLLAEDGLKIKDTSMLRRIMPFYNGECAKQSMKALRAELHEATAPHGCHDAWVAQTSSAKKNVSLLEKKPSVAVKSQHGDVAALNEDGYLAVAALKDDEEMKTFIRRLSKSEGLSVMNEGGLSGFAKYYSGVCATQSFAALVKELKTVQPVVKTTAITYELQPGEDIGELTERIAAAIGLKSDQVDIGSEEDVAPDAESLKKALANKLRVDEERVHVMNFDDRKKASAIASHPIVTKETHSLAKSRAAPKKPAKTVVVTVTSAGGVSVEDALKKFAGESSTGVKVYREPVTMTASIPKPASCGGGWVAPGSAK